MSISSDNLPTNSNNTTHCCPLLLCYFILNRTECKHCAMGRASTNYDRTMIVRLNRNNCFELSRNLRSPIKRRTLRTLQFEFLRQKSKKVALSHFERKISNQKSKAKIKGFISKTSQAVLQASSSSSIHHCFLYWR